MKGFEIPTVSMRPPRLKVDKSMTLSFDTGELNNNEKLLLLQNDGLLGSLIFVPENQTEAPPKIDTSYEGKKPSERLHNIIFVYWKQKNIEMDFEQFYREQMEKFIQAYKDKLDNY